MAKDETKAAVAAPPMQIEYWDIEKLIPYARNPRKNDDAVPKMAGLIREFGFKVPVIIRSTGDVIDGHLRLKAAWSLGMTQIPVVIADEWTDAQVRAFRLAVNRSAEWADWDDELLKLELQDLSLENFDLELIGFNDLDISAGSVEGLTDPDEVPEVPEQPISQQGDVWICGGHRIMCGDSTSFEDMERLCDGEKVDMWLTDPPYNVNYTGGTGMTIQNDNMGDGEFRQFLRDAYSTADGVMKPGAVFYIWHADSEGYNFRGAAKDIGWTVRQCLIWKKDRLVLGRQDYHWAHEPCIYGWKDGASHLWASDRKQTTILEFDRPTHSELHPTMKPVALIEYEMLNNTKGADIVLDSFGGSGTTLIAAEKNGRRARLMELDPKYCDVIVKRWQDFTGDKAILEGDGRTFAEFAEIRTKS